MTNDPFRNKSTRRDFVKRGSLAAAGVPSLFLRSPSQALSVAPTSTVYRLDEAGGVDSDGGFRGLDDLLALMGQHGLKFFKSLVETVDSGPDGLIGSDDVIMLKVNSQWDDRGMTNVDLVRGLVQRIVKHPGGFTGEIVFVENVQFKDVEDVFGWQTVTNSEDRKQTYRDIINDFSRKGYRISGYDWRSSKWKTGGLDVVTTPDDHSTDDYYHDPTGASEHYPRFTTEFGTRINFKYGVRTGSGYNNSKLKLINLPTLKDHQYKRMVTACLKNYMGVIAPSWGDDWNINYHQNFQFLVGRMVETTRFPDLNILDATHIILHNGPEGDAANAVEAKTLLAGTDPVALDYHAAKHVLFPRSNDSRHNPDEDNSLRTCLTAAFLDLRNLGYQVVSALGDSAFRLVENKVTAGSYWSIY